MANGFSHLKDSCRKNWGEGIDVAPMVVVSTGVRGPRTTESVAAARERLKSWLDINTEHYAADGDLRVMAYNSPFVRRASA